MIKKTIAFFLGFVSLFYFFACISSPFAYYTKRLLGIVSNSRHWFFAFGIAVVCIFYLAISIWNHCKSYQNATWKKINEIDYIFLIILFASFFYIIYQLLTNRAMFGKFTLFSLNDFSFLFFPFVAYCIGVLFLLISIWRLRNKTLLQTIYYLGFLKQNPIYSFFGFVMSFLLFCNVFVLAYLGLTEQMVLFLFALFLSMAISQVFFQWNSLNNSYHLVLDKTIKDKIKAEQLKTELITNVSHDIKTPLTSIINYIDLIQKLHIDHLALNEYTTVLEKKSRRLQMLIEDLIEASKVGTGNVSVNLAPIDLNELIGQVVGEFSDLFEANNLAFVRKQNDTFTVLADGRHLFRVMENIFANAAKYSQKNTRIYAEVTKEDNHVTFSLKNTSKEALGIPAEELMAQFVRGDRSRHTSGSGLGLYIAQSLTQLMNGHFQLSISGDLFVVEVTLPLVYTAYTA